jgi:hypothetical protein
MNYCKGSFSYDDTGIVRIIDGVARTFGLGFYTTKNIIVGGIGDISKE